MQKGLRIKISLVIIVPLAIGIILTSLAPIVYLFNYYPSFLNDYKDKMMDNQKQTLLQMSELLALSSSLAYVQKVFNFVNIEGDLINNYLYYGLETNPGLNYSKIYMNSNSIANNRYCSVNISLWNYQNISNFNDLSNQTKNNLYMNAIFDPLIKAISNVGLFVGGIQNNYSCDSNENELIYKQSYITHSNDGLFYSNPPMWNSSDSQMNCNLTTTDCNLCSKSIKTPYYEPRCRNYYNITVQEESFDAILIDPYNFTDGSVGQSVCRGIWNYTNSEIILVLCMDITTADFSQQQLIRTIQTDSLYTYVLNTKGETLYYKNMNDIFWQNITKLEFGKNKDEIKDYEKNILPLFENHVTEFKYFTKNGDKMMIAVAPIDIVTSSSFNKKHLASVGVVMKKSELEKKFDSLVETCNYTLYIDLVFQLIMALAIIVICIYLTYKITKNILIPIERLAKILKRMKEGDLAVDIIAAYEPSPLEVQSLYEVFDKLRVVLRFNSVSQSSITEAIFIYSQALHLFSNFGNEKGMELCYRELGYICYKINKWEESAEYLEKSLHLAIKLNIYDSEVIGKRKADTAKALTKANIKKNYAMNLFAEALTVFSNCNNSTRVIGCLLDVAENLIENRELNESLLDFIEKKLKDFRLSDLSLANQKFLFIKAAYLKSQGHDRKACYLLSNIIDLHSDFIPEIWIKSVDLLIQICIKHSIDCKSLMPLKSQRLFGRKDTVLILSESLVHGPISWILPGFLKSLLEPNDRLSLLQFGQGVNLKFNLTKFPLNIFSLSKESQGESNNKLLYDCIHEGYRQLRVNNIIRKDHSQLKEIIIIITDCVDCGSKSSFVDIVKLIESSHIEVVVVNCYLDEKVFNALLLASDRCSVFHIKFPEQAKIVFKQLEAFLCPYKEVFIGDYN